ncbi:hypothetical protein [Curtobacterium flaccumfaciens]|uniref:hypothetical protein n=1 Tax=Curtobacterium flaccumfaciens TaxID=2035 RepID=UPI001125BFB7|nr:hypothetical protein [Curtobacterium flaccumfaciens]TPG09394.1 hypothetical protein EAH85_03790 [Curtobacterium flaccumfaciens]
MANLDDFTIRELNFIENTIGASIASVAGSEDKPQGMFLAAMATVYSKRENPDFTLEDALNMKMTDLNALLLDEEEDASGEE